MVFPGALDTTPWLGNFNTAYANIVTFPEEGHVKSITTWMVAPYTPDWAENQAQYYPPDVVARCAILTYWYDPNASGGACIKAKLVAQTNKQNILNGINTFKLTNKVRVHKNQQYFLAIIGRQCNMAWYHDSTNNIGYQAQAYNGGGTYPDGGETYPAVVEDPIYLYESLIMGPMLPGYFSIESEFEPGVASLTLPAILNLRARIKP